MHVIEWAIIFQLAWKLVLEQLIQLSARLAWEYWSGQITIKEFDIAKVDFPTTSDEIVVFSIPDFLPRRGLCCCRVYLRSLPPD